MSLTSTIARSLTRFQPLVTAAGKFAARGMDRPGVAKQLHQIFAQHRYHLLKHHYYLPIPDEADLDSDFGRQTSSLPGLEMNAASALQLMETVFPPHLAKFREKFPIEPSNDPKGFHLVNGNFMAIDAHVYYAFIRHFQPRRIIEIGAGNSTRVAAAACLANAETGGVASKLTVIEPYRTAPLLEGFPGLTEVIPSIVQRVPLDRFTQLEAGDILFIDSSHVLRSGGDVQYEYLEILPRLAPGVLVHIHDISLPKPYPRVYADYHYYWNEQFLLQAFLAFNSRFTVVWPGNYLMVNHAAQLEAMFPECARMRQTYPQWEPSSFWMRVCQ